MSDNICDVCGEETAACLTLCPDCNNIIRGKLKAYKKVLKLLNKVDEPETIYYREIIKEWVKKEKGDLK
jgi:hypothetical protein